MELIIDRNVAIAFFFAIFWGTAISSMRTFKLFHIWTFKRPGHGWRVIVRLAIGVVILNVIPLLICYFIYMEPWFVIVPKQSPAMFICAGVSSLSVFSIVFLLPGIMQTGLGRLIYPKDDCWEKIAKSKDDDIIKEDGACVFLLTAVVYIIVPIIVSALLVRI